MPLPTLPPPRPTLERQTPTQIELSGSLWPGVQQFEGYGTPSLSDSFCPTSDLQKEPARTHNKTQARTQWFGTQNYQEMKCVFVPGIQMSADLSTQYRKLTERAYGVPEGHFQLVSNEQRGNIFSDVSAAAVVVGSTSNAARTDPLTQHDITKAVLTQLRTNPDKDILLVGHSEGGAHILRALDALQRSIFDKAFAEAKLNAKIEKYQEAEKNQRNKGFWGKVTSYFSSSNSELMNKKTSHQAEKTLQWWLKNRERVFVDTYGIGVVAVADGFEKNVNVYCDAWDPVVWGSVSESYLITTLVDFTSPRKDYNLIESHCVHVENKENYFRNPLQKHYYEGLLKGRRVLELSEKR